jgi:hypothetical protein
VLAVTIVSVALTSLIALAALVASLWQQRERFAHERNMADRESVRSILADTAAILHRVEYSVDAVNSAVFGHADTLADPAHPERLEPIHDLERVGRELDQAIGQIRVQLGPGSSATKSLEEAGEASLNVWRKSRLIRLPRPGNVARVGERNELLFEQVEKSRDEFKAAVACFVERAHAVAGAQLPDLVAAESGPAGVDR